MDKAFKIGDVVQLKSGGRKITVTAYGSDKNNLTVACEWFDDRGKFFSRVFPQDSLVLASEPTGIQVTFVKSEQDSAQRAPGPILQLPRTGWKKESS